MEWLAAGMVANGQPEDEVAEHVVLANVREATDEEHDEFRAKVGPTGRA